jgi:hypothetical protein
MGIRFTASRLASSIVNYLRPANMQSLQDSDNAARGAERWNCAESAWDEYLEDVRNWALAEGLYSSASSPAGDLGNSDCRISPVDLDTVKELRK